LNVTVPVGLNPPARVAVSKIAPPSVTAGDACVLIVGVARVTRTDSLGSLQAVLARTTPATLYSATQRYVPAALVMNVGDWYVNCPAVTGTDETTGVPAQLASSGP
jgi:hypothetical protein